VSFSTTEALEEAVDRVDIKINMKNHEDLVKLLFDKVCSLLAVKGIKLRFMSRKGMKTGSYTKAYINLQKKLITLDIYSPKTMKPLSINGLIRTIVHEIAHLQKPPYRQRHRGRWINRQHFPEFYKQVEKNLNKIKKDSILGMHFRD
jgi:hypothetical protein